MRTTLLSLAFIFLLAAPAAQARLGETKEQCTARYGASTSTIKSGKLVYKKAGLVLFISFGADGRADSLTVFHDDKDAQGNPMPLTQKEIDTLLNANVGELKWVKSPLGKENEEWLTPKGELLAVHDTSGHSLTLMTKNYADRASHAHLGDTPEQCEARYGKPESMPDDLLGYQRDGMAVIVNFFEGHADMVVFIHEETDASGKQKPFSESEIKQLLATYNGGRTWKKTISTSDYWSWDGKGGSTEEAYATYDIEKRRLVLTSKGSEERSRAKTKAAEADKLKGF